jgi:hypothetical protein
VQHEPRIKHPRLSTLPLLNIACGGCRASAMGAIEPLSKSSLQIEIAHRQHRPARLA